MALSCHETKETHRADELQTDNFKVSCWFNVQSDFDSLKWIKKLDYYDSLGISEILLGGNVEGLQKLIPLARLHGIKIHASVWTLNRPNNSIAMKHSKWYAVKKLGNNSLEYRAYVNYYQWLSPFHPEARSYIKSNIENLCLKEGIESIHLDYVRFPDVDLGANLQNMV